MKSNLIAVVSLKKLPKSILRKYEFYDGNKILLGGYKRKGRELTPDPNANIEVWYYTARETSELQKFLENKERVKTDSGYAFYVRLVNKKLLLIPLLLLLLIGLYFGVSSLKHNDTPAPVVPDKNIEGEDKVEVEPTTVDDGIIYAGFPSDFEINKKVQYLSVQNSEENADKFYTYVQILEGDEIIFDMEGSVIEPGKYKNINLYELLDKGDHTIVICQYGCRMDGYYSQVGSSTSQSVNVKVVK